MDRAQFLQGLRTGGPRSTSFGGNVPHSANPTTTRFASSSLQSQGEDQLADQLNGMNLGNSAMAANLDAARLQQQQIQQQLLITQAQFGMLVTQHSGPVAEAQAMQLQMEIMRLQALQQQSNFQVQMMIQSQMAGQQNQNRRVSELQVPSTAGPLTSSFTDAQTRTAAANQFRARAVGRVATMKASASEEQTSQAAVLSPPATAGLSGKFAPVRAVSSSLNPNATAFVGRFNPDLSVAISAASKKPVVGSTPVTPTYGSTTVISGGTSLGGSPATPSTSYVSGLANLASSPPTAPTKSDSAMSWRRGSAASTPVSSSPVPGLNNSSSAPLRQRSISPSTSGASTPTRLTIEGLSDSTSGTAVTPLKTRPSPLRFTSSNESIGAAVPRTNSPTDSTGSASGDERSSSRGSPTNSTPPSTASLSGTSKEREEASRKLYEGLGIGRPSPSPVKLSFNPNAVPFGLNTASIISSFVAATPAAAVAAPPSTQTAKVEPVRQPIGPPCSVDELGPMNFAARLRKKLGGPSLSASQGEVAAAC